MENSKGIMIVFEGGEGTGKSTAMEKVYNTLKETKDIKVIKTREPGGSEIAEKIRGIIVDKNNTDIDPKTEALLFAAARRQHLVEKVIPYLEKGYIVLCDRYLGSSMAYQGHARGLGMDNILNINKFAIDDYMPDLTLWFDLKPEVGLKRISDNNRETNRLDNEKMEFYKKVDEGYKILWCKDFGNVKPIDAEKSKDDVYESCMIEIYKFIKTNENKATELQKRIELYCHKYGIVKQTDTTYGKKSSSEYWMRKDYDDLTLFHNHNRIEKIYFDKETEKILKIVCYNEKQRITIIYYYDNEKYDVIENEYKNNKPFSWKYYKNGQAIKMVCVENNDFEITVPDLNGELNINHK